jgi:hypothetical protein
MFSKFFSYTSAADEALKYNGGQTLKNLSTFVSPSNGIDHVSGIVSKGAQKAADAIVESSGAFKELEGEDTSALTWRFVADSLTFGLVAPSLLVYAISQGATYLLIPVFAMMIFLASRK